MKILVQWATSVPGDWTEIDSRDWAKQAFRPVPSQASGLQPDARTGWVHAINVQGVVFQGDHYHVDDLGDGSIKVTCWSDDPEDWAPSEVWAREVVFEPLQADASFGGAYNTRQTWTWYVNDPDAKVGLVGARGRAVPWSWFQPPTRHVAHGVWAPEDLHGALMAARSLRGWREWTDGVPAGLVRDGQVLDQRKQGLYLVPKGTRTYYHSNTIAAWGSHTALNEHELVTSPSGVATNVAAVVGGNGAICFLGVSPAGEPDSAAWPTGTYRCQLDVPLVGADLVFGLLNLGTQGVGHFARVDSAGALDLETHAQDQAAFTGSGLHMASWTGSWSAGSATDRFEILIAAQRVSGHGNQDLTLQLNEFDDFVDGPWAAAVGGADAHFFGAGL